VKKPVKAKPVPKAKTHRKPVHVTPKITAARHAAALRAAKTRAANAKKAKTHAKARGYAVGELLPVCSLEAVAMSLRLQGERVSADDVAMRWETLGELSIPDAAEAFGVSVGPGRMAAVTGLRPGAYVAADCPASGWLSQPPARTSHNSALLLGVNIPGPHAVLATPGGWWSWGELYAPWRCRIEEVWEVTW
jgi:hypothetical protein